MFMSNNTHLVYSAEIKDKCFKINLSSLFWIDNQAIKFARKMFNSSEYIRRSQKLYVSTTSMSPCILSHFAVHESTSYSDPQFFALWKMRHRQLESCSHKVVTGSKTMTFSSPPLASFPNIPTVWEMHILYKEAAEVSQGKQKVKIKT